jgi:hypothetical protein
VFSSANPGNYTITATSQQDPTQLGTFPVAVVAGASNVLPIVVDGGPPALVAQNQIYVNGAFATVTVCVPNTTTCQTIDHVLVDTGSIGLRLLAQGTAGGELNPAGFSLQTDANGNPIAQCNQFVDGFTWGSVSVATIQMAGETAFSVPIQIIGDTRVPSVPSSCSSNGPDESNLNALGAYGVLGVGNFIQDCGQGCTTGTPPNVYYSCSNGTCTPTLVSLAQQVTNPVWALPADNNGVLIDLPSVPTGGTTTVNGSLIFGIGTQLNNALGSATVFDIDNTPTDTTYTYFTTTFNAQTNSCSYIDSGSNAYFFPSSGYPPLSNASCGSQNPGFYCPSSLLTLTATNQSASGTNGSSGTVPFNVGNANTLLSNTQFTAFSELGGPNAPISGCGNSFDWGLPFFYGRQIGTSPGVFTAIEQQRVSGTSFVGPFWAY